MDSLKLIDRDSKRPTMFDLEMKHIKEIKNGKALTATGRWYDIVCDCKDYEFIEADEETNIPESYRVCNICNRVTYLKDLK